MNPPKDTKPDFSATAKVITDSRKQVLSIPIIALTANALSHQVQEYLAAGMDGRSVTGRGRLPASSILTWRR